jgi:hypothetical protein
MGTTSTTVTTDWTVVKDANGHPTVVSGTDVEVFVNNSAAPFTGEAWSDIDTMTAIPTGATITDLSFSLTAQVDGSRDFSTFPCSPSIDFVVRADYLSGTWVPFGRFGAGGVGSLPNDNDPHAITYLNSTYRVASSGGGFTDAEVVALAAALADPGSPVVAVVDGPNGGATGTGIWYRAPLTLTFFWTGGSTFAPTLRKYPVPALRVYPAPQTVRGGLRRGPSAIN